ncbi:MAG TPA: DUF6232 family protein [Candidatus Dormibacteraeota bacterium]|jgi:hypothetical protein|nr:DUF6232 family protein [Candidatus Dormibacteraeota bacterium]
MTQESLFFQSGNVTVTNARFIVGTQTFAIRGITSVQSVMTPVSYAGPGLVGLASLLFMAVEFFHGEIFIGIWGIPILAACIWIMIRQKPTFAVVLRTAGGEITAYKSANRNDIAQIIQALNEAIVSHG